jgi:hypothetical protein
MNNTSTKFTTGPDTRRVVGRRTPTAASFKRRVLTALSPDLDNTLNRLATLARAGDEQAIIASANLMAVALAIPAKGGTKAAAE